MGFLDKLFGKKDDNSKGLKYEDLGNGTCKIMGRGKNRDEEIEIPAEINGLKVVALAEEAFHKDEKIRAVTIPEGITEIPKQCFESCYYLSSVKLPEGLKKIGYSAFSSISSLCNVDFPDSVEEIDGLAFSGAGIKYDGIVKFPKNLKKIGLGAFWYISHLKTLEFPDGLEEIGETAFLACKELTDVVIPASLKKIGKRAFEKCAKLDSIKFMGTKEQWNAIEKKEGWNEEAGKCTLTFIGELKAGREYTYRGLAVSYSDDDTCAITGIGVYAESDVVIPDTIDGYKVVKIEKEAFRDDDDITSVVIPEGVTEIGEGAFSHCTSLEEVKIPRGVEKIGKYAFEHCESLEEITIPAGTEFIGGNAFSCCSSLEKVSLPYGLKSIEKLVFSECSKLKKVNVPKGVTYIDEFAFDKCDSIVELSLPEGLRSIKEFAFNLCDKLSVVTMYAGLEEIESNAFNDCSCLDEIKFLGTKEQWDNIEKAEKWNKGTGECRINCTGAETLGIETKNVVKTAEADPERAKYSKGFDVYNNGNGTCSIIGRGTCEDEEIIIPTYIEGARVVEIDDNVFENPDFKLTKVVIPEGVTSIGEYAFADCDDLETVVLPESLTSIGQYAFANCRSLESIKIPDGIEIIGYSVFDSCKSLSNVEFGKGLKEIDDMAFSECSSLHKMYIPEGVTSIGEYAFSECEGLIDVHFPSTLASISESAFEYCSNIRSASFGGTVAEWRKIKKGDGWNLSVDNIQIECTDTSTFIDDMNWELEDLDVDEDKYEDEDEDYEGFAWEQPAGYKLSNSCGIVGMGDYEDAELVVPETIKGMSVISIEGFRDCSEITSVFLPEGLKYIGSYAFKYCNNLEKVELPDTLVEIGTEAFMGCPFGDITVPKNTERIYAGAFKDCEYLDSVILPASLKSIRKEAFANCDWLNEIIFEGTVAQWKQIEKDEKWNDGTGEITIKCTDGNVSSEEDDVGGLEYNVYNNECEITSIGGYKGNEVIIPEKINGYQVTCIAEDAFKDCTNITIVVIPDEVRFIKADTFNGCSELEKIKLPAKLCGIGENAFEYCSSLKEVTIPNGVESIQLGAFDGCSSLEKVDLPEKLKTLGGYAFYCCSSLESIVIPNGVDTIAKCTFSECESLSSVTLPATIKLIAKDAFSECESLEEIIFGGTKAEWANITKEDGWDDATDIVTVKCTDGDIGEDDIDGDGDDEPGDLDIVLSSDVKDDEEEDPNAELDRENEELYNSLLDLFTGDDDDEDEAEEEEEEEEDTFEYEKRSDTECAITDRGNCEDTDIVIPAKINGMAVSTIDFYAFSNCEEITSVTISEGVKYISDNAFEYCKNLKEVKIPSTVIDIGEDAFRKCEALEEITYNGTMDEFDEVELGAGWLDGTDMAGVTCTDGIYWI